MDEKVERALLDEADALTSVEQRRADATDRLFANQQRIDAEREAMADALIANQRVTSFDEALRFARSWIVTAAQYAANADYYRDERDKLLLTLVRAYRQLFRSQTNDVENPMQPEAFQLLASGHTAAFETLQTAVRERVDPSPPTLRGAFSEDLYNEDGSAVTAEQARDRNKAAPVPTEPRAAVSYVERGDGRILAVWNHRYHGWAMPGGKVEDGETIEVAQARELLEETGLGTAGASLVYDAPTAMKDSHITSDRGRHVFVFRVVVCGVPREIEEGCPVRWVTREEFLAESPFRELYREMFEKVPPG